jgi:hypothetical protein
MSSHTTCFICGSGSSLSILKVRCIEETTIRLRVDGTMGVKVQKIVYGPVRNVFDAGKSTCPRNGSARIKNITYGAVPYKSQVHRYRILPCKTQLPIGVQHSLRNTTCFTCGSGSSLSNQKVRCTHRMGLRFVRKWFSRKTKKFGIFAGEESSAFRLFFRILSYAKKCRPQ